MRSSIFELFLAAKDKLSSSSRRIGRDLLGVCMYVSVLCYRNVLRETSYDCSFPATHFIFIANTRVRSDSEMYISKIPCISKHNRMCERELGNSINSEDLRRNRIDTTKVFSFRALGSIIKPVISKTSILQSLA